MGNTENIPSHYPQHPQENPKVDVRNVSLQAKRIAQVKQLNLFYQSIVCRILAQKRQKHLIDIIKKMTVQQKLQDFVMQVHQANIQILDSFYEHIGKTWFENYSKKQGSKSKAHILPPFDREIGICGSIQIMRQNNNWQPISNRYAQIVDLSRGVSKLPDYQIFKQRGLQVIKKQQVCFIILAGGKNIRYDLNEYKQCDPIAELPSNSTLIQLLLKKLQALGRLIDTPIRIFIMVDSQEKKKKIRKIKSTKIPDCKYISVDFLTQISYGCLDPEGRLVINDLDQVYFHPNGNGDIWGNFQEKNLQKMQLDNYKYYQIFGVSNMLQHCFDCFMIGKLATEQLPWITMATKVKQPKDMDPVIFINKNKSIHVRDPQQIGSGMDYNNISQFPYGCQHIFLNNSVFSRDFLQKAVKSQRWLQYRKYHCKKKFINNRPPLSNYQYILTFERELTDIFQMTNIIYEEQPNKKSVGTPSTTSLNFLRQTCRSVTDNHTFPTMANRNQGAIVLMDQQEYNSPFYDRTDRIIGAVSLSQQYKKWLGIADLGYGPNQQKDGEYYEEKVKVMCEIDSFISLEGENLEDTIQQLRHMNGNIEYPIYISLQHNFENVQQISNTQDSIIMNRSVKYK